MAAHLASDNLINVNKCCVFLALLTGCGVARGSDTQQPGASFQSTAGSLGATGGQAKDPNDKGSSGNEGRSSTGASTGGGTAGSTGSTGATTGGGTTAGGTTGGGTTGGGSSGSGLFVMGYHVGYQDSLMPVSEIDFNGLTHLAVGRALPEANGTLATHFDIDAVNGPLFADRAVAAAHAAQRQAILMVGGAGAHAEFVAAGANANTRNALVAAIVDFAQAHDFDGVDIDWEPIAPDEEANVLALLDGLRAVWPTMTLTFPVMWFNANFESADSFYGELAERVDHINVMSYEMAGAYSGWQSWHSSALDGEGAAYPTSIQWSVDSYLLAGVPAAKLGIGIGFYGLCYGDGVNGPRQVLNGASIVAGDNIMSYARIMDHYYSAAADAFDDTAKVPYLALGSVVTGPSNATGCRYVTYDDARSIAAKAAFVKERGLGGAIIWTVGQGYRSSLPAGTRQPLLKATHDSFLASSPAE